MNQDSPTNSSTTHATPVGSRVPHRLAVLLVCATFPLIWVGGLVTTMDAGMAVPDWPTTFGYNMFLYPWQTWVAGPWDQFVEHGHRLLGAVVGLLTILLAVSLWLADRRSWMKGLGLLAIVAVVFQGLLGGLRVIEDERLLAQIHGSFGPAFFALTVALAVCTSRLWLQEAPTANLNGACKLKRLALWTACFAYIQLLAGAQLRHMAVEGDAKVFRISVAAHLFLALVLTIHVMWLAARIWNLPAVPAALSWPGALLAAGILMQLTLGAGTWIVNYGWPSWLQDVGWAQTQVVMRRGLAQSMFTTMHVAAGSLILGACVTIALRSFRLFRDQAEIVSVTAHAAGAAA